MEELFPHLSPADDEIIANEKKIEEAVAEKVRKMGTVQLGEKKKEQVDLEKMELANNQKFGLCQALIAQGDWEKAQ